MKMHYKQEELQKYKEQVKDLREHNVLLKGENSFLRAEIKVVKQHIDFHIAGRPILKFVADYKQLE